MKKQKLIFLIFTFIFLSYSSYSQKKYFVPDNFSTIQSALNKANDGDTIIVRPGTYFENIILDENFANNVKLYSETNAINTIINAGGGKSCLEISKFSFSSNENDKFEMKGFTITNSSLRSGLQFQYVDVNLLDLIIENNVFNSNGWSYGGGLYLYNSNVFIDNCIIRNNKTISTDWSYGGGCYFTGCNINISRSKIYNNTSISTNGWAYGGGLYFNDCKNSLISSCDINFNKVTTPLWNYGGAIHCDNFQEFSNLIIENSYIIGNEVDTGNWHDGSAISMSDTKLTINNTVISQNQATLNKLSVSTIYIENINSDSTILVVNNSSIANNSGPILIDDFSSSINNLDINNSILWNRTSTQILKNTALVNLNNCVIPTGNTGKGLVNTKPTFADTILLIPTKDYSGLNKGSLQYSTSKDILGTPRPQNGLPDIGAYEISGQKFYVKAQFFWDKNQNGIKENSEPFINQGGIIIDNNLFEYNSDDYGIFAYLSKGNYNIKYNSTILQNFALTTDNANLDIILDSINEIKSIRYGLKPIENISNLEAFLYSPILRCQTEINMIAQLKNLGTITESGVLYFKYDPIFKFISTNNSAIKIIGDTLISYDYSNLEPFEKLDLVIRLRVPAINQSNIDSLYTFKLWTQINNRSVIYCYQDKIRCSFDPNDKIVNPNREDNLVLFNNELYYTIRFENTGNDYAQDIIVKDILDKNLDLSTFEVLNCSHKNILETKREGANLSFEFKNIYLPAKKYDSEKCQGFISYKIKPLPNLEENTKIENTAYIYFDLNSPIVTNTTNSIMVSSFITNTKDIEDNKIKYYPNPSKDVVYFSDILNKIEIISTNGQLLDTKYNTNTLHINHLPEGLFLLKCYKNNKFQIVKINKIN